MILAAVYSFVHLLLGVLAAVWTARAMKNAGYTDGCLVFAVAFLAFVFWPLALAILLVFAAIDFVTEGD